MSRRNCLALAAVLLSFFLVRGRLLGQEQRAEYPEWSWDHVPVYLHFGSKHQLTEDQVEQAARMSNLICLEKAHGRITDRDCPERIMGEDAARIKRSNPDAKVLFYWNTLIAWPFTSYNKDFAQTHPKDWTLRRKTDDTPILKSRLGDVSVYQYNLLNPKTRDWWAETAGNAVKELGFDGVYMDAISQAKRTVLLNEGWGRDQSPKLDQAAVEMMKRLRSEIGDDRLLIFNGLRTVRGVADVATAGGSKFLEFADGVKIEHFDQLASATKEDIVLYWQMATKAAADGKIVLYKAWPDHGANFTNREFMNRSAADRETLARDKIAFPLACYLIAAQPHSYFCYGWGYDVDDGQLVDYPEYGHKLGPPASNAKRDDQNPWKFARQFEHASVEVNLESRVARIEWKSSGQTVVSKASSRNQIDDRWEKQNAQVLALRELTTPPKMRPAESTASDVGQEASMKPIYFDGLPYRGKPTRVFAWLGMPDSIAEGTATEVPGVVLVHGGGGTAFKEWVKKWNDEGFAAISIAVEGQTDQRMPPETDQKRGAWRSHSWAGPSRNGIYGDSDQPLEDQWMYHAVADTVLANSLLRSLPGVDKDHVGLMGISWGGVITSTVVGIDSRFDFAIPTYGCGHLADASNQYGRALGKNELYRNVWDPMVRLSNAKMPVLWLSWPGDLHFPLDCQANCYRQASGPQAVALVPGMRHGHGPGWNRGESYAFAKSVVQHNRPWCEQVETKLVGRKSKATFTSHRDYPVARAVLISTTDLGPTGDRSWSETPATLNRQGGRYTASAMLPVGTTAWFMNIHSGDLVTSSEFQQVVVPSDKAPENESK